MMTQVCCPYAQAEVAAHQAGSGSTRDAHTAPKAVCTRYSAGCDRSPRGLVIAEAAAAVQGTDDSIVYRARTVHLVVIGMDPRTRCAQAARGSCSCPIAYVGMCRVGASCAPDKVP